MISDPVEWVRVHIQHYSGAAAVQAEREFSTGAGSGRSPDQSRFAGAPNQTARLTRQNCRECGREALQIWRNGHFALVITDCHMSEMDGYGLAKSIRKIESEQKLRPVPIIAWTANALDEEVRNCHAAGMNELLVKPASLAQLKAVLVKSLSLALDGKDETGALVESELCDKTRVIDFSELSKVVPDAADHIRSDYNELLEILEKDELVIVGEIAHRMVGSSRMVGAKQLAKACKAVEWSARRKDTTDTKKSKELLDDAIKQFDNFLLQKSD